MRLLSDVASVVLALALAAGAAQAAPYWSSDQVRAARSVASEPALTFVMRTETRESDKPGRTQVAQITLTESYAHLDETGGQQILHDRQLCETLTWRGGGMLESASCHALPMFAYLELRNRLVLAKMLAAGDIGDADPAWSEAALGVSLRVGQPLTVVQKGDATEFRLGKALMASVSGDAGAVNPQEMERFVRLLARQTPMHPQVRAAIAARKSLPARLELHSRSGGVIVNQSVVLIEDLQRAERAYPLPAGLASVLRATPADTPRGRGVARALAVIDAGGKDAPRPLASLIADLKSSKVPLEPVMLFMNITQQYAAEVKPGADDVLPQIVPSLRTALADPQAQRFMEINSLAGDARARGDRQAAARFLASSPSLEHLKFGTFRQVTYANLVSVSDTSKWDPAIRAAMPEQPEDGYWIHIAAYPWAGNAYGDPGDVLGRQYQTGEAWIAYDLGRAVDPNWRDGVLAAVAAREGDLKSRAPDFY